MNIYQSSRSTASAVSVEAAATLALQALAHILSDDQLADRFIALTGLTPETLRSRADDPEVLTAVLEFLLSHEVDLIACAAALATAPTQFARAHGLLGQV
jgi:hypothetical protein